VTTSSYGKIMGYFVTVTFDIVQAGKSPHGLGVYAKITDSLKAVDYSKVAHGKKKLSLKLPSNTFVAEFSSDADDKDQVVNLVKSELRSIFLQHGVKGKYFISVGKDWKWKMGAF
jgi:hypothetical protein